MNATSGILLALVGVWVLTQVLGGNALGRLGVIDNSGAVQNAGSSVGGAAAGGAIIGGHILGGG